MTRETFEILYRAIMNTGRIPAGNMRGRQPILPAKQVLAFLWSMANQEPSRLVADRFNIAMSSVDRGAQALADLSTEYIHMETERFAQMVRKFSELCSERKKRTTSGGCPQFPKRFSGKIPFHLTSNRNFRIFLTNGKHPRSPLVALLKSKST